jgi:hypothetical protein
MTDDPLDFMHGALATLPADPAQTTEDDLATIAAAHEGLWRVIEGGKAANVELVRRIDAGTIDRATGELEKAQLDAVGHAAEQAHEKLADYTRRAFDAHGFNLTALVDGHK